MFAFSISRWLFSASGYGTRTEIRSTYSIKMSAVCEQRWQQHMTFPLLSVRPSHYLSRWLQTWTPYSLDSFSCSQVGGVTDLVSMIVWSIKVVIDLNASSNLFIYSTWNYFMQIFSNLSLFHDTVCLHVLCMAFQMNCASIAIFSQIWPVSGFIITYCRNNLY